MRTPDVSFSDTVRSEVTPSVFVVFVYYVRPISDRVLRIPQQADEQRDREIQQARDRERDRMRAAAAAPPPPPLQANAYPGAPPPQAPPVPGLPPVRP